MLALCQQIWRTQQWPEDWKRTFYIPIPKKGSAKDCSNYRTIALIPHASKIILKILQTRIKQYMERELPDVQAVFRRGRGTRNQIANIRWITDKTREFQKEIYFCFIDHTNPPPPPILEAPSERSNMKDVLEAHGLVLSPKFRIFFKINQFSSEHMYPIRKINN